MTNNEIGAIILAAGASRRLGAAKQLLEFRGVTLLRRIAETSIGENLRTIVVLGEQRELFKKEIEDLPLETVFNQDWERGMSSSLKVGLGKLLEIAPDVEAVLILVCDQPLVDGKTVRRLIDKQIESRKKIAAAEYAETLGVPAIFARELFDELLNLDGDRGARFLIKKYAALDVAKVSAPEAAFDIDTPEDYEKLIAER